jgi:hypothetical protein
MTDAQHIIYGLHSNIPSCCVSFFITEWPRLVASFGGARNRDPNVAYVRCPNCLTTKRLSVVHFCDKSCEPFLREYKLEQFYETNELPTTQIETYIRS